MAALREQLGQREQHAGLIIDDQDRGHGRLGHLTRRSRSRASFYQRAATAELGVAVGLAGNVIVAVVPSPSLLA